MRTSIFEKLFIIILIFTLFLSFEVNAQIPAPIIKSISPNSGSTSGGTRITITGGNFFSGIYVMIGNKQATNLSIPSNTQIIATTPSGPAGYANVTVGYSGGPATTVKSGFFYISPPNIDEIFPNSGNVSGGTRVTITGSDFGGWSGGDVEFRTFINPTVTFEGRNAQIQSANEKQIIVTTPQGNIGPADVRVINPDGQSDVWRSGFTYFGQPVIKSVSPSKGPLSGGTIIQITGENFADDSPLTVFLPPTVLLGNREAEVLNYAPNLISAKTPSGNAGIVNVTVTNRDGLSGILRNGFTYVNEPIIDYISPNFGHISGGTNVIINGKNFVQGATVRFGENFADAAVSSATQINAITPPNPSGLVNVIVTNPDKQQGILVNGFKYVAPPVVNAGADQTSFEGQMVAIRAIFSDDDLNNTHTAQINWGDRSVSEGIVAEQGYSGVVMGTHFYTDNGVYSVKVTVIDQYGIFNSDTMTFTINNAVPEISSISNQTISEGNPVASITAIFKDPGLSDTHKAVVFWGDGKSDIIDPAKSPINISHLYPGDDGSYDVTVMVTDDDGGIGKTTFNIIVANENPIISSIKNQSVPESNPTVNISISFSDPGKLDKHKAVIDWGDGKTDNIDPAATPINAGHIYLNDDGNYNVVIAVIDDDNGIGEKSFVVEVLNENPIVTAIGNQKVSEGNPLVNINTTFTDPGKLDTHRASIDWGDGKIDTIDPATSPIKASHTYQKDDGSYNVAVIVTDDDGGTGITEFTVKVDNEAPIIATMQDQSVPEGNPVISINATFTDPGTLDKHRANITWGDGRSDNIDPALSPIKISHAYPKDDGTYNVTVTVTDDNGGSGSASFVVKVTNENPVVTAMQDQSLLEGNPVVSINTAFTDPGTLDKHKAVITWGDGKTDTIDPATSPVKTSHTYPKDDGVYKATVTVTDDNSGSGSASFTVRVTNENPVLETIQNQSIPEGNPIVSFVVAFNDPGTLDTHKATINWGNGKTDTIDPVTSSSKASYTYPKDDGIYNVTVTVTDDDGGKDTASFKVTVNNENPVISVPGDQNISEGNPVLNINVAFNDPGSLDKHKATINWGDSKTENIDPATSPIKVTHTYKNDNNIYTVILTVIDDNDGRDTKSFKVIVNNEPPVVNAGSDQKVGKGKTFTIAASFTDPSDLDTHTASIDWGDGSSIAPGTVSEKAGSGTVTGSHVYNNDGTYTISIFVRDDDGSTGKGTFLVTVLGNINVDAGKDQEADEGQRIEIKANFTDDNVNNTHTATIDWGDGATDKAQLSESRGIGTVSGSHTYADDGIYSAVVTVTALSQDIIIGVDTVVFTVKNVVPKVSPLNDQKLTEGAPSITINVTFTDPGIRDKHKAIITWGDGKNDTVDPATSPIKASHTYPKDDGSYKAIVAVTDDGNGKGEVSFAVTVSNENPTVTAIKDQAVTEGNPLINISTDFSDPGTLDKHKVVISWGDGKSDTVDPATSPIKASHTYPKDNGSYKATVTVTDDDNGSAAASFTVTVSNENPTITALKDQSVQESNAAVNINAVFADPGTLDKHKAIIDWGDGKKDTIDPAISPINISHDYLKDDGSYKATITITDDDGGIATTSFTVTVTNENPVISDLGDQSISEGNPVISVSATFNDPGTLDKHQATIAWGDGKTDTINPATSPIKVSHTYPKDDGIYTSTITVTDDDGGKDSKSFKTTVNNAAPVVDAGTDKTANEGESVIVIANFSDEGALDTHTATIYWGDDTPIEAANITEQNGTGTATGRHIYGKSGTYVVTVTITDDNKASSSGKFTMVVSSRPMTVSGISPASGPLIGGTEVTITGSNFQSAATVIIGNNSATNVVFVSSTQIRAVTPSGPIGPADVTVINPNRQAGVLKNGFTYVEIQSPIVKITISPATATIQKGNTQAFNLTGQDAAGKSLSLDNTDAEWSVDDAGIGRIDSGGTFTALDIGITYINAILKENRSISARAEVKVPDTEPPVARQATPSVGNKNVPVTSEIQVTFSEDIDPGSLTGGVIVKGQDNRDIKGTLDLTGNILTFMPNEPFGDEETVNVTVTKSLKDMAGNPIASEFRFSFSTGIGIWPGDANNDKIVDILDILPMGQYWNLKGFGRDEMNSDWNIQPATPWTPDKIATYADANGDGIVNEKDIIPVALNWKLSHSIAGKASPLREIHADVTLLPVYEAMYNVLNAMPVETEGTLALKAALRKYMGEIQLQAKPGASMLLQNYPNPFNPETWIPYQLSQDALVRISIYNLQGKLIKNLEIGQKTAGYYISRENSVYWDGKDQSGERAASGIYFCIMQAGKFSQIKKLMLSQ